MKQLILTFMAAMMVATSSFAMSPHYDTDGFKDYTTVQGPNIIINEYTIKVAADAISDWDYFWGTTLNPENTGWNDFWYQCQDPDKSTGDCIGTLAVGVGLGLVAPLVITGVAIAGIASLPAAGTVWLPATGLSGGLIITM